MPYLSTAELSRIILLLLQVLLPQRELQERRPGIVDIGAYTFYGCTGAKIQSLTIASSGIRSVGAFAFSGVTHLESLTISQKDGVFIGAGAFQNCTGLESLTLPIDMNAVGSGIAPIFDGCTGITSITFTGTANGDGFDYNETSGSEYDETPWSNTQK